MRGLRFFSVSTLFAGARVGGSAPAGPANARIKLTRRTRHPWRSGIEFLLGRNPAVSVEAETVPHKITSASVAVQPELYFCSLAVSIENAEGEIARPGDMS